AGPSGEFMPILYMIVQKHGYDGLAVATILAGLMLITMGLFKLGSMIKFIPYPVTTGFTAGIALIIFSSQMKDFFGLQMGNPPPEFVGKWYAYVEAFRQHGISYYATGIALGGVAVIGVLRKFAPRLPGAIVAVILAAAVVSIFHLDDAGRFGNHAVATIGSKF